MRLLVQPSYSPWGEVQHCETLCPGAYQVSTAGHGGVMVDMRIVDKTLSEAAQKCGFREGRFLCFEEDCDALVPVRELLDKGLHTAPVNEHFMPGEYSQVIDRGLRQFHPEYWADYVKKQQKPSVKERLAGKPVPGKQSAPKSKGREER